MNKPPNRITGRTIIGAIAWEVAGFSNKLEMPYPIEEAARLIKTIIR